MEQHLKDSISYNLQEPSKIPSVETSREVENAWWAVLDSDAHHSSSDASLFSSSLPVLQCQKLNFASSQYSGQSVDDGLPSFDKLHQEYEGKDPLEDVELSALGSLLRGDEDELLAGVADDFDLTGLPTQLEDLEDDLFDSGGGMELDFEPQESLSIGISKLNLSDGHSTSGIVHYGVPNGVGIIAGEHPYGEHPSRTLFVRNINSNVEDSELQSLFEQYGDIRNLYTACKHRGFVMISYYDIRHARNAMRALQNKPLRRRKLDIHFSIPKDNPSEKDVNQGTLVVFNLDASVSNDDLRRIFGDYGEVKEIRETPHKRHHKFIEFYDVRDAEAALKALNKSDIAGKRIKLEPSRPGGARRSWMQQLSQDLEHDDAWPIQHQVGSPAAISPPGNWPCYSSPVDHSPSQDHSQSQALGALSPMKSNHLQGLASILPSHVSNPVKIAPIGKDQQRFSHVNQVSGNARSQGMGYLLSHSFPEQKLSTSPGHTSSFSESNSFSSGVGTLSGPQFLWGTPPLFSECMKSSAWPTSSMDHPCSSSGQGQGYLHSNQHKRFLGSNHHNHAGSAPSGGFTDARFGYFPESPEASLINQVTLGGIGISRAGGSYMMNMGAHPAMSVGFALPGNMTEIGSPGSSIMSLPKNGSMFLGNGSFQGIGATSNDRLLDLSQSQQVEYGVNLTDSKKQNQLDLNKIRSGEDTRTTLMIKNIPNKYTSKMLLAAIDENLWGSYDFLYLPIDFKNKCNVGYAFINMISPSHIIPFYEAFNGKKWEKFNSEKIASLAYARIQGKAALVSHFQNSSLMNEDRRCRPILFQSEGQEINKGLLLNSNLNIYIRQPDGSYSGDSLESPKGILTRELNMK